MPPTREPAPRNDAGTAPAAVVDDPPIPSRRYGDLFVAVQTQRVFADSKTFVDCAPRRHPDDILAAYHAQQDAPGFDLARFVHEHFEVQRPPDSHYVSDPGQSLVQHIDGLWDVLTRDPARHPVHSSLLPLPLPYVVPGGRFGEICYWDSYFTMIGLAESGRSDLLRSTLDNFAWLVDRYGHVPNGNRSYYLSRSQPPMFALMVALAARRGVADPEPYLPRLVREHAFWMQGEEALRAGDCVLQCVRMPDGALLNRYRDALDVPRDEAYAEDLATAAAQVARPAAEVYRELRSAAASGWDFTSRWCDEGEGLPSTRTTTIVPVDLNAFLFALESLVAKLSAATGDGESADAFARRARARRAAMQRWLWDEPAGAFLDYDLLRDRRRSALSGASAATLYVGLATPLQARRSADALSARLLLQGGLACTRTDSGEQWDSPNGWAPLHWLAIAGCRRYGLDALADEIRRRWLATVGSLYRREAKLVEKYALVHVPEGAVGGCGGEYPLQDGFGWTNGVTRRLLHEAPGDPAHGARAGRPRG
jgi:alpha,alpha-trehalase